MGWKHGGYRDSRSIVVIAVSRSRGVASLAALGISFAVLFVYVLPRLSAGQDPLRVILLGGAMIVPPSVYLAHGVSRKTTNPRSVEVIDVSITRGC